MASSHSTRDTSSPPGAPRPSITPPGIPSETIQTSPVSAEATAVMLGSSTCARTDSRTVKPGWERTAAASATVLETSGVTFFGAEILTPLADRLAESTLAKEGADELLLAPTSDVTAGVLWLLVEETATGIPKINVSDAAALTADLKDVRIFSRAIIMHLRSWSDSRAGFLPRRGAQPVAGNRQAPKS